MAKSTNLLSANPVIAGDKRFNFSFEHRGGKNGGYWVCISPWAQNTDPLQPDRCLVLIGSDRNPGVTQKRIEPAPRFSLGKFNDLKPEAIHQAARFISHILGVYSNSEGPGAESVLETMEGLDPELTRSAIAYGKFLQPATPPAPTDVAPAPAGVLLPDRAVLLIDTRPTVQSDTHFAFLVLAAEVDGMPHYFVLPTAHELTSAPLAEHKEYASKALQTFGNMGHSTIAVGLVQFTSPESDETGESNAIADHLAKHGLTQILQDIDAIQVTSI
jgi:hypothetical protein